MFPSLEKHSSQSSSSRETNDIRDHCYMTPEDLQDHKHALKELNDKNPSNYVANYVFSHLNKIVLPNGKHHALGYLLNLYMFDNPGWMDKFSKIKSSPEELQKEKEKALKLLSTIKVFPKQKQDILRKTLKWIQEGESKYKVPFPYPEMTIWISDQIKLDDRKVSQKGNP